MGAGLIGLAMLLPGLDRAMSEPAAQPDHATIHRAADGQFYIEADVAGERVRFMVDGGGDEIVVAGDDANRIGLGGSGAAELPSLAIRTRRFSKVPVRVARDLPVSLVGRGWLARAGVADVSGDRLVMR